MEISPRRNLEECQALPKYSLLKQSIADQKSRNKSVLCKRPEFFNTIAPQYKTNDLL